MDEQEISAWVEWSCLAFYGKTWKCLLSLEDSKWRKMGYNCWEMRFRRNGERGELRTKEIFSFEVGMLTVVIPGVDVEE